MESKIVQQNAKTVTFRLLEDDRKELDIIVRKLETTKSAFFRSKLRNMLKTLSEMKKECSPEKVHETQSFPPELQTNSAFEAKIDQLVSSVELKPY